MPIVVTCTCGARHQFPDHAAGRKARCKNCGRVYLIPNQGAKEESVLEMDLLAAADEAARTSAGVAAIAAEPLASSGHPAAAPSEEEGPAQVSLFVRDAVRAFGLFGNFRNVIAWLVMVVFELGGLYVARLVVNLIPVPIVNLVMGLTVVLFVYGVICSFLLNIVTEVGGGENDLPSASSFTGFWDSVFLPLLEFVGTAVLLLLPAIVTALVMWRGGYGWQDIQVPMLALGAAGLFMWPISLLAASMGGLSVFYRPDLLVRGIVAAPFQYIFIWILLLVAAGIRLAGEFLAATGLVGVTQSIGGRLVLGALASAIQFYTMIVSMCLIGLYYRHYKQRLPWGMD